MTRDASTQTARTTMSAETLAGLTERITDTAEIDGGTLNHVEITEMADGSCRTVAVATMIDGSGLEQTYRVISPAPWNSPAWIAGSGWILEVNNGSMWVTLDEEPA